MIDLDEFERLAEAYEQHRRRMQAKLLTGPFTREELETAYADANRYSAAMKPAAVLALVAELRAAREVVELARQHATGHEPYPLPGLTAALDDYDQAAGS
jgi:hypothetical protein